MQVHFFVCMVPCRSHNALAVSAQQYGLSSLWLNSFLPGADAESPNNIGDGGGSAKGGKQSHVVTVSLSGLQKMITVTRTSKSLHCGP